jgi:hypothetical protein
MGIQPLLNAFNYDEFSTRLIKTNSINPNTTIGSETTLINVSGKGFLAIALCSANNAVNTGTFQIILDGVSYYSQNTTNYIKGIMPILPSSMGGNTAQLYMNSDLYTSITYDGNILFNNEPVFFKQSCVIKYVALNSTSINLNYMYEMGVK